MVKSDNLPGSFRDLSGVENLCSNISIVIFGTLHCNRNMRDGLIAGIKHYCLVMSLRFFSISHCLTRSSVHPAVCELDVCTGG